MKKFTENEIPYEDFERMGFSLKITLKSAE